MFDNIDEAYDYYKNKLCCYGEKVIDERGDELYQLPFVNIIFNDFILTVGNVKTIRVPASSNLNYNSLKNYAEQLLDGDLNGFKYTYGHRLISYFDVNQIEVMIDRLRNNDKSRRSVAVTYNPKLDCKEEDIPCLIMIECMIYDGKLDMGVVFRSNDIKYAFSSNMYGLMNLQLYISNKLNIDVGKLYYICFNPHYKVI